MTISVKYYLEQNFITYNSFKKIKNYDTVVYIDCSYDQLTELPKLPNSLKELHCSNNQLISLPELPNSLKQLYCWINNFIKNGKHKYLKQIIYF